MYKHHDMDLYSIPKGPSTNTTTTLGFNMGNCLNCFWPSSCLLVDLDPQGLQIKQSSLLAAAPKKGPREGHSWVQGRVQHRCSALGTPRGRCLSLIEQCLHEPWAYTKVPSKGICPMLDLLDSGSEAQALHGCCDQNSQISNVGCLNLCS